MNPYTATTKVTLEQLKGFQWRRIIVFSALIFAAGNIVGILSGISIARWEIYGITMEEALTNARLIRRGAYGIIAALLYWRLVAPLANARWLHVLLAYACLQVIDIIVSLTLFQTAVSDLVELGSLSRGALAALVGWLMASLWPNKMSRPTQVRDAA